MHKQRDYLFDNYKALLILLVVTGHFVELASDENLLMECVKWLIFAFHMPAFVFISGYFSKKKPKLKSLVQKLIVPYLVFEVLYYLLYTYVIHKETQLWLLYPKFTLWYLMALFVWKLVTPLVMKIPGHLILSVAAGLWVGASGLDDNFLTLPRMIVFYPFFLLGVWMQPDVVLHLREKISKKMAWMLLGVFGVVIIGMALFTDISTRVFHGRYHYATLDQGVLEGMIIRLLCYGISLAITMLILCVMSAKENRFSYLGERTMAIYLLHGLICSFVKANWGEPGIIPETIVLLGISVLVTGILSLNVFTRMVNLQLKIKHK